MNQALPDTVVVVDTDVLSQVFVSTSGPNHRELRELLAGLLPVIATQTCAELRAWPLLRNWGSSRCQQLERILSSTTVIPITRSSTPSLN